MTRSPKRPPIEVLKVCICSGGGASQECDAIKYDGKLWLVPQWLDEPGSGTTKPRRIIRIDSLPHEPIDGTESKTAPHRSSKSRRWFRWGRRMVKTGGCNSAPS